MSLFLPLHRLPSFLLPFHFMACQRSTTITLQDSRRDGSDLRDRAILNTVLNPPERTTCWACSTSSACQKLYLTTHPRLNTWQKHAPKYDYRVNTGVSMWGHFMLFLMEIVLDRSADPERPQAQESNPETFC